MRKGKTVIVSTKKRQKAGKKKKGFKHMTSKVHRTHSGHSMKAYRKAQMTYKKGKGKR